MFRLDSLEIKDGMVMQDNKNIIIVVLSILLIISVLLCVKSTFKNNENKSNFVATEQGKNKTEIKNKDNNEKYVVGRTEKVNYEKLVKEFIGNNTEDKLEIKENYFDDNYNSNVLFKANLGIAEQKTLDGKKPSKDYGEIRIEEAEKRNEDMIRKLGIDELQTKKFELNSSPYQKNRGKSSIIFSFKGMKKIEEKTYEVIFKVYYYPGNKPNYCSNFINGFELNIIEKKLE